MTVALGSCGMTEDFKSKSIFSGQKIICAPTLNVTKCYKTYGMNAPPSNLNAFVDANTKSCASNVFEPIKYERVCTVCAFVLSHLKGARCNW